VANLIFHPEIPSPIGALRFVEHLVERACDHIGAASLVRRARPPPGA